MHQKLRLGGRILLIIIKKKRNFWYIYVKYYGLGWVDCRIII